MKIVFLIMTLILIACDSKEKKWTQKASDGSYVAPEDLITICCYQYGPNYMYEVDTNINDEYEILTRCEKTEGTFNRGACDKSDTMYEGYCKIKGDVRFYYNVKDFTESTAKSHCEANGHSVWIKG
jgi:hypothetical protein